MPWHSRAQRLRASGHTFRFIAGQVGADLGEVTAYLTRLENEREARRNVPVSGETGRILPRNRLSRPW